MKQAVFRESIQQRIAQHRTPQVNEGTSGLIDDLLIRWHRWADKTETVGGYPRECPSCRGYQSSKQWRGTDVDAEGNVYQASVDAWEARIANAVETLIESIPQPHRLALQFNARNLSTGAGVWASPRLPQGEALVVLVVEARGMFGQRLSDAGIV